MPAGSKPSPRLLRAVGENGRALGLTRAIRFPAPEGSWCWAPEEGRLLPPVAARPELPEPSLLRLELADEPPGSALVGPFFPHQSELAGRLADRLEESGWAVALAVAGGAAAPPASSSRRLLLDANLGPERSSLPALVPVLQEAERCFGLPREGDHGVPLQTTREELRAVIDFAESTADRGGELSFDRLLHRSEEPLRPALLAAIRPLPWPRGVPNLGVWAAARLRSEALRRSFSEAEGVAAELFAAARRIETMVPPLERIAGAGMLGSVPGLGAEPLRLLGEILRS